MPVYLDMGVRGGGGERGGGGGEELGRYFLLRILVRTIRTVLIKWRRSEMERKEGKEERKGKERIIDGAV